MEILSTQSETEHYNLEQSLRLELLMGCLRVNGNSIKCRELLCRGLAIKTSSQSA